MATFPFLRFGCIAHLISEMGIRVDSFLAILRYVGSLCFGFWEYMSGRSGNGSA